MTNELELYDLMNQLFEKKKQTGKRTQPLIEELPADQGRKDKLRRMLQYLLDENESLFSY